MKGVILGINPRAMLIDISHEIETHDIMAGAFVLASACDHFPQGTIHIAVVDPGVGSKRRAIIVETSKGYFVGPDNGIFTLMCGREKVTRIVTIQNPKFRVSAVSQTFHGRDIFAPAGAYLSLGVPAELFGPPVDAVEMISLPSPRVTGRTMEGQVIHIDRFGNLITNISARLFGCFVGTGTQEIWAENHRVSGPYSSYEEGRGRGVFAIFGSSDLLEISTTGENAHKMLGLARGAVVRVLKPTKGARKK